MKLGENNHLTRKSFSPSFIRIGQKLWIFYQWLIFESVPFFLPQTFLVAYQSSNCHCLYHFCWITKVISRNVSIWAPKDFMKVPATDFDLFWNLWKISRSCMKNSANRMSNYSNNPINLNTNSFQFLADPISNVRGFCYFSLDHLIKSAQDQG